MAVATAAGCTDDETPVAVPRERGRSTTTLPADAFGTGPGARDEEPPPPPSVAWVSQFGGPGSETVTGVAGRDRSVLVVGSTDGPLGLAPAEPLGGVDVLVAELSAEDGAVATLDQHGGTGDDAATGVAVAPGGGDALTCGTTSSQLGPGTGFDPVGGSVDGWCAPVGSDGALGPATQSGSDDDDRFAAVSVSADGGHGVVVGSTVGLFPGAQDPTGGLLGGGDALVARVDLGGRPVWARQFGTAGSDAAEAVAPVADGDTAVAGTTDGPIEGPHLGAEDGWVARFDPFGNLRWMTQLGTERSDRFLGVAAGGEARRGTELFCAAGATAGTMGDATAGGEDAVVAALDASGDRLWTTQFGSASDDEAAAVLVDGGLVYVVATVGGPVDGAEEAELPVDTGGLGGRDVLVAGLDAASGRVLWLLQIGSPADETATSVALGEEGLLLVGGSTGGQLASTAPGGATDGFVVALEPPAGGGGAASSV